MCSITNGNKGDGACGMALLDLHRGRVMGHMSNGRHGHKGQGDGEQG